MAATKVRHRAPVAHSLESERTAEPGMRASMPSPIDARRRGREGLKFFTIPEVADSLSVCTRTVRRWIDDGDLVAHRLGAAVRISEDDLRAFLARHRGG
jgi:excisionase family DNA binding protein